MKKDLESIKNNLNNVLGLSNKIEAQRDAFREVLNYNFYLFKIGGDFRIEFGKRMYPVVSEEIDRLIIQKKEHLDFNEKEIDWKNIAWFELEDYKLAIGRAESESEAFYEEIEKEKDSLKKENENRKEKIADNLIKKAEDDDLGSVIDIEETIKKVNDYLIHNRVWGQCYFKVRSRSFASTIMENAGYKMKFDIEVVSVHSGSDVEVEEVYAPLQIAEAVEHALNLLESQKEEEREDLEEEHCQWHSGNGISVDVGKEISEALSLSKEKTINQRIHLTEDDFFEELKKNLSIKGLNNFFMNNGFGDRISIAKQLRSDYENLFYCNCEKDGSVNILIHSDRDIVTLKAMERAIEVYKSFK